MVASGHIASAEPVTTKNSKLEVNATIPQIHGIGTRPVLMLAYVSGLMMGSIAKANPVKTHPSVNMKPALIPPARDLAGPSIGDEMIMPNIPPTIMKTIAHVGV